MREQDRIGLQANIQCDALGEGRGGTCALGYYRRKGVGGAPGGMIVNAGTTDWAYGLAGGDPAVCRITMNVLRELGCAEPAGAS